MIGSIRQGDVLLVPVDKEPPVDLAPVTQIILALGESTGHAHRLSGLVLDWEVDEQRYVRVDGEAGLLSHEDHDPVPAAVVESGQTYRVVLQEEWDLAGQWRKVED